MKTMTPRERVVAALLRQPVDKIPFTCYETHLPRCEAERHLRNAGLCIIDRTYPTFSTEMPEVKTCHVPLRGEDGAARVKTIYETPLGVLSTLDRPVPGTTWHEEMIFKGPEDYKPLEFLIRQRRYRPAYDDFLEAKRMVGDDIFLRASFHYSPLMEIIYNLMGLERFSVEWAENRDEVMRLYDALTEDRRRIYRVIAESPAFAVNYCGNVSAEVIGLRRFEEYVLPHYDECAEIMHQHGKLLGVHLDANNRALAAAIARSQIDYIEAFTPPPLCDMTVAEARRAWPNKVLWLNFPSSVFLAGPQAVEEATRQILQEAAPGDGFLVSITEDAPKEQWQEGFAAIARTIDEYGRYPIRP